MIALDFDNVAAMRLQEFDDERDINLRQMDVVAGAVMPQIQIEHIN